MPTASFGTLFNEQTFRQETVDRHVLADLEYARPVGAGRLSVRGAYDLFSYDGVYPLAPAAGDTPTLVAESGALGTRWSVGARLTHPLPGKHVVTAGLEFIDNLAQNQWGRYIDPLTILYDANRSTVQQAAYVQDEVKLGRWFIVNAGARYDHYEAFSRVTPRASLIVTPSPAQSFKYLFGQAFRAPNAYELNEFYFGERAQRLRPETIDTHEAVWERYTNDWLRTSVSTYWYKADRLITLVPDASAFIGTTYVNEGQVRAQGLELEAQMRLPYNLQGVTSYALQRSRDLVTNASLVNSPAQMAKMRLSAPGPVRGSSLSMELIAVGSRKTLAGAMLDATTTADVAFILPVGRSLQLTASARNLFDLDYTEPASSNHLQDAIPQNGRTLRVGLRWSPWAR